MHSDDVDDTLATSSCHRDAGFSLAEAVIATAILATAIASLAQVLAMSVATNRIARYASTAAMLAAQKMEALRGITYGFDPLGLPLTDTTTNLAVSPPTPDGGTGLSASPATALQVSTPGYVDYVDAFGHTVGAGGSSVPRGAVYIRRWSVEPLPTNPNNTLVLQVLVARARGTSTVNQGRVSRMPDEARFVTVKTRKAT